MGVGKIESKHHILSLKLSAFEIMGQVTTIYTNKTGILTKNEKKVTKFQLGKDAVKDDTSLDMVGDFLKLLQQVVGLNKIGTVHKPQFASLLAFFTITYIDSNPRRPRLFSSSTPCQTQPLAHPKDKCYVNEKLYRCNILLISE